MTQNDQQRHQRKQASSPASASPPFTVAAYDESDFGAGGIDDNGGGTPSG
jgi:hypothetical protein